ncbi:MAG: TonB-dependent receptor [Ideonella sp.]|nr:TonB-dependent receptor [Ideonella sp.]
MPPSGWRACTTSTNRSIATNPSTRASRCCPAAGGNVNFNQTVKNKSAAVFGQTDFALTQQLNLSTGLRYTRDTKDADQAAVNLDPSDATPGIPLFPGQPYHIVASKSWGALTGKLGLDYRIDRDKMVYASVSRGYKSGLFPSQNNSVQSVGVALDPEKVWNYEVGAKTEWLDRRLRVNATVFSLDYKDLQQFSLTPGLVLVSYNVDAKIKGAEIEVLAAPTNWLTLGGNVAQLDTEVTRGSFNNASLVGKQLAKAPKLTYSLFAEVTQAMAGGQVAARLEYSHKDAYFTATSNTLAGAFPAVGLVDGRLSYKMSGRDLEVSLWGKNLGNKVYQAHVIEFLGNGFSTFAPPRTYGVSLNWKFGG